MITSCEHSHLKCSAGPSLYRFSHNFSGQTTCVRLASKPTGFQLERRTRRKRARVVALGGESLLCCNGRGGMYRSIFHLKVTEDINRYSTSIKPKVHAGMQDLELHGVPAEPTHDVSVDTRTGDSLEMDRLSVLKLKLEKEGISCNSLEPGQYECILCPKCRGGYRISRSFSVFIREDLNIAMWHCFRDECGWRGHVLASDGASSTSEIIGLNSKGRRMLTEKDLRLDQLSDELIGYFSERKISRPTLQRNGIMQRTSKNEERKTESIFYGVDDVEEASEIIIVEGEIDKLSMEEAGYQNCISVPNGASLKLSTNKSLNEEGSKPLYLLNCKEYLEKASRIILATDSDGPGEALSEELAQHLGMERCWRVVWPRKNELDFFKDANEVLVCLGANALKELIQNAEPWQHTCSTPSGKDVREPVRKEEQENVNQRI